MKRAHDPVSGRLRSRSTRFSLTLSRPTPPLGPPTRSLISSSTIAIGLPRVGTHPPSRTPIVILHHSPSPTRRGVLAWDVPRPDRRAPPSTCRTLGISCPHFLPSPPPEPPSKPPPLGTRRPALPRGGQSGRRRLHGAPVGAHEDPVRGPAVLTRGEDVEADGLRWDPRRRPARGSPRPARRRRCDPESGSGRDPLHVASPEAFRTTLLARPSALPRDHSAGPSDPVDPPPGTTPDPPTKKSRHLGTARSFASTTSTRGVTPSSRPFERRPYPRTARGRFATMRSHAPR